MAANGLEPRDTFGLSWQVIDSAGPGVDGALQLLLAEDRANSSAAVVAPVTAVAVRLGWIDGR